jgi:hypothetical protein
MFFHILVVRAEIEAALILSAPWTVLKPPAPVAVKAGAARS